MRRATTKGQHAHTDVDYPDDCHILFGKETAGLPRDFIAAHPEDTIRIPQIPNARSLNLSNSVAIVCYEALRQMGFPGMQ